MQKQLLITCALVCFMLVCCTSLKPINGDKALSSNIFSSILKQPEAISTGFADADKEFALDDDFLNNVKPKPFSSLKRTKEGAYQLAPGFYEIVCKSYCLHAGTYGPSSGDGYLAAPLKGVRKNIIQSLLRNSGNNPSVKQIDVQLLIWAVLARADFKHLSNNLKATALQLLSPKELFELNGGIIGVLPTVFLEHLKQQLPPVAQQIVEAENKLRQLYSKGTATYEEFKSAAVLAGAAPVDKPEFKRGRWCKQQQGYYIRFFPDGFQKTTVQVYVPKAAASSGKQSANAFAQSGFAWPAIDLTDIVAVPANTFAQRLGFGGGGYNPPIGGGGEFGGGGASGDIGGGGESGGGGASDSYGDDPKPEEKKEEEKKPDKKEKKKEDKKKEDKKKDEKKPDEDKKNIDPPKKDDSKDDDGKGDPKKDTDKKGSGKGKVGDVDDDYVRNKLPKCFIVALKKFGKTEAEIVEYFKNYHNIRCNKRFFNDVDEILDRENPHGLSDCNVYALWGYTTNLFYRDLNKWLREGTNKGNTEAITEAINDGLDKLPNYPGQFVYRGIEVPLSDLPQFLQDYKAGKTNTWESFTSCGGSKRGSFAGRPNVNVVFQIEHTTGKDISKFADGIRCGMPPMPPPEILIKPGSTFKSTGDPVFDKPSGKWIIKVTQIK